MNTATEIITKNDLMLLELPVTLDEVIAQLEKIITFCETNNNCAGYFAVLYYKVTSNLKGCISKKDFEDCERMERLGVTFANRYLDSFHSWIAGKHMTDSWQVTFDAVSDNTSIVLQHLLLAMNAHINFDLGIATVHVMHGYPLDGIHNDFNGINALLATMIDNIEDCLTKVNPLMRLLDLKIYKYDEMLVEFSISTARDGAWKFSQELSGKAGPEYENYIHVRDERIRELGSNISKPRAFLLKTVVKLIRLFEKKNVASVIKILGK